jgi:hypothetical protein
MANPFLGTMPINTPSQITDPIGDGFLTMTPYHVAVLLFLALVLITAMKLAGFRAMVGIGRG